MLPGDCHSSISTSQLSVTKQNLQWIVCGEVKPLGLSGFSPKKAFHWYVVLTPTPLKSFYVLTICIHVCMPCLL